MEMQELTIKRRQATGKEVAKRLRRAGEVPAILYGGAKPEPVVVDPKAVLIGDVLTVAQLRAPEGVRILTPPGQAVATVVPPMAEEAPVAAAPAAATVTEPEVLTERKPKEEEAPPEEGKKARRPEKAE